MRKRRFFGALIFAVPVVVAAATFAVAGDGGKSQFKADTLTGYQETAIGAISTVGTGTFDEAVRAIRAGAVYANVHTTRWAGGEIRGQVNDSNQRADPQ